MLKPVQFGANYEICLPDYRNKMAEQFKLLPERQSDRLELDFSKDPEFKTSEWELKDPDMYKVSVYFDDFNDLNIATENPTSKTRTERLLVEKTLKELEKRLGLPSEKTKQILGRLFTNNADHVSNSLVRLESRNE